MSEAYEIGVTLALSDGVSDGIGRARREIAALQRVLTSGGVSVAQLRNAAAAASPLAKPQFEPQEAGRTSPAPSSATVPTNLPIYNEVLVDARASRAAPTDVNTAETSTAAVNNRAHRAEKQSAHVDAAQTEVRQPFAPQTADIRSVPNARETARELRPTVSREAVTLGRLVPERTFAPAPRSTLPSPQMEQSTAEMTQLQPIIWEKGRSPATAQTAADIPPGLKHSRAAAAAPSIYKQSSLPDEGVAFDQASFRRPTAPHAMGNLEESGGPAQAPQPRGAAPTLPSVSVESPAEPLGSPGAPIAQGMQGPAEGDVYLDGMLVGRWMSRFLAQEAGRASAGPTGFDGRRGWLLPGATVGT